MEIEALKAEVADLKLEMKKAGEDREKQNKEFQVVVADQRATQKLLEAALGILKGFYEKAALLQTSQTTQQLAGQAPPPGFKSYEKNKKSGGVMGMMQGIIDDAKNMEAESMISKSDMKAKTEGEKVEAETEHESIMETLEQLMSENADLHKSCDFTLKNFELRQSARDDEIEALKQALAMFSGASFSAFLQKN